MPGVPAIQEAEQGHHLNQGDGGYSEPRSCHYIPAWVTEQDSIKRKKGRKGRREGGRKEGKVPLTFK